MAATVIVFGADGQVGSALGRVALPEGWQVRRLGRRDADITQPDQVRASLTDDTIGVINAAAYTAVDKAESERDLAYAVNATAPGVIARVCAERRLPVLHISTDFVFDGSKAGPYLEDDPVGPLSVYGASKEAGERAVRAAAEKHIILRTSWVYAPQGSNFVRTMLRVGRERGHLRVVGDQTGAPTAALDIAATLIAMLQRAESAGWGTFHYSGTGVTTWFDFAAAVFEEAARHGNPVPELTRITTAEYPTPARRPANSALDCGKIARAYGIAAPSWREGVARCVDEIYRQEAGS